MHNDLDPKLVDELLAYATNDELNAASLLRHKDGAAAGVCFLAQQMAEKLLKALLLAATADYPRTHQFDVLLDLLTPTHHTIRQHIGEDAIVLQPYIIEPRYPADLPLEHFTWKEAEAAFAAALAIKQFVYEHIGRADNTDAAA